MWRYFKDMKAMHAYYANLGGNANDAEHIGGAAFVMVRARARTVGSTHARAQLHALALRVPSPLPPTHTSP